MKKYIVEIIILIIQLCIFYIFPMFAGPTDIMGMIIIILFVTFILSILLGWMSKNTLKLFVPLIISILFIPSVYIYYNETALVHAVWYMCTSFVGLMVGCVVRKYYLYL